MEKLISAIFSLKQRTQQEATRLFAWLFYPVAHLGVVMGHGPSGLFTAQQGP